MIVSSGLLKFPIRNSSEKLLYFYCSIGIDSRHWIPAISAYAKDETNSVSPSEGEIKINTSKTKMLLIRTAFSPFQLVQLEQAFRRSQYLVGSERKQLAKQLMLSETQVQIATINKCAISIININYLYWFHFHEI
jgi:hypothetical protein